MDENINDIEAGTVSNVPRTSSKKMRKRKHLDALLKFRSNKTQSNDVIRSSEDELFLPHQKPTITKTRSPSHRRCWFYFKRILSFTFISMIIVTCITLIYANIELKNEVENLSLRINEIEKKFSNVNLNNISLMITQIKTRLDLLENSNVPKKSIQVSDITDQLDERTSQLNSFRNEFQSIKNNFEQLTSFVHNSSDKTSAILTQFQTNLDNLRTQFDECKCSKSESVHLKPSIVDTDQLQQSTITKPTVVIDENNQPKDNNTDVEHIVNRAPTTV